MYLHSNMEGQQRSVGDTTALLNERHAFVIQSGHRTELELVLSPLFWHFYLAYMYIAKSFFRGKLYLLVLNWWTFLLLHLQRQLFFSHGFLQLFFAEKLWWNSVFFSWKVKKTNWSLESMGNFWRIQETILKKMLGSSDLGHPLP